MAKDEAYSEAEKESFCVGSSFPESSEGILGNVAGEMQLKLLTKLDENLIARDSSKRIQNQTQIFQIQKEKQATIHGTSQSW